MRTFTPSTYLDLGANAIGPLLNGAAQMSGFARVRTGTMPSTLDHYFFIVRVGGTTSIAARINGPGVSAPRAFSVGCRGSATDTETRINGPTNAIQDNTEYGLGWVLDYANDAARLYVDGVLQTPSFNNVAFTPTSYTHSASSIGSDFISHSSVGFEGSIQDIAVWTGDIGTAGFEALQVYGPELVRPDILGDTMRIIGRRSPEPGQRGRISGTVSGATRVDHRRIRYPARGAVQIIGG